MSGPKGYQVRLSPEAQRALDEGSARDRCRALLARREDALGQLALLGTTASLRKVPGLAASSLETLQETERALAQEIVDLGIRGEETRKESVRRALRARIGAEAIDALTTGPVAGPDRLPALADRARSLSESVMRTVDRIAELDEAARTLLTARTERVLALIRQGELTAADNSLLGLQTDVEEARRRHREVAKVRLIAAELAVRVADLPPADAALIREHAAVCTTTPQLKDLQAEAHRLRAAWRSKRDRSYVIEQTREALRELGYEVGGDFAEVADAGQIVVSRPDLPDHGVELTFTALAPRVLARVVAYQETSAQRDTEVEEMTCTDLHRLREAWRRHGVDAELYHDSAPGQTPVKRVAGPEQRPTQTAPQHWRLP